MRAASRRVAPQHGEDIGAARLRQSTPDTLAHVTPQQLETWALRIIESVKAKHAVEDTRVELKAAWLDAHKAARRIGGHANAARGAPILWLIGVDETAGVVGADPQDPAAWYPAVASRFDGVAPALLLHLQIPSEAKMIAALLFDTSRFPYVVLNADFGRAGVVVKYEVPWRQSTGLRTATREDLLRMIGPHQEAPTCEVLYAELNETTLRPGPACWTLLLELYFAPRSSERVVVPAHRCRITLQTPHGPWPLNVRFRPDRGSSAKHSPMVEASGADMVFKGPAQVQVYGTLETDRNLIGQPVELHAAVTMRTALSDVPIAFNVPLRPAGGASRESRWTFEPDEASMILA